MKARHDIQSIIRRLIIALVKIGRMNGYIWMS